MTGDDSRLRRNTGIRSLFHVVQMVTSVHVVRLPSCEACVQVLKDDDGNSWPPVSNMRRKERFVHNIDPAVIGS
jgi:hypothetical protein